MDDRTHDPDTRVNLQRRRFLTAATTVVGAAGIGAAAVPFIASMQPSAAAQAAGAPIEVDVSKVEEGAIITVKWRSRPVWVVHRSAAQVQRLKGLAPRLKDPQSKQPQQIPSCANVQRSLKPEYWVAVGICTHLGCVPTFRPQVGPPDLGADWPGGFLCACHGSRYDLAGRVFNGSPAPLNLPVPPHYYPEPKTLRVGELRGGKEQNWHPLAW